MDKIKINLLPQEIKEQAKKEAKQSIVNKISIGLLGVLILATSTILAVAILQSTSLNSLNSEIEKEKERINSSKETEAVVRLLKNRLDTINQFSTKRYKQSEVFDLITGLFPQDVTLDMVVIDKTTKVAVQGGTKDTLALQSFFDNLTDPKTNEGKIVAVVVESLSKSQAGDITFELSINLAQGVI